MSGAKTVATDRWSRLDARIEALLTRRTNPTRRDASLADALRVIAAAMRTGATLQQAMGRVADRGTDIVASASATAAARMSLGLPVVGEVDRFAARVDTPAAQLFAQVVRVQHRRGGDLGAPCHRLASLLHERIRLDAEARAATAQARFSARAVTAIPVVLAVAGAWRSPDAARAALQPGPLLLASPGIVLVILGALVARRIARTAMALGGGATTSGSDRSLMRRLAGDGPRSRQAARLAGAALVCGAPALLRGGPMSIGLAVTAVGAAAAWPWTERARSRRRHQGIAQSGVEGLLEVSIALFAAGATSHQVAVLAPAATSEPLRSELAPAVHRINLGRTIASAFDGLPVVAAAPALDGWVHALCTSADLGAPAVDTLEHLLRDARAARREQLRAIAQTAAPRMQLALVLLVVPGVMWLLLLATLGGLVEQLQAAGVL